jgi:hypothetical protein
MTLKPKPLRLMKISSAGVSRRKVIDFHLDRLSGIWGESKIVAIIFLQVRFHGLIVRHF